MEKSRNTETTTTTTTTTDINNAVNTVHAERKRMLLSEVYVHKVRKLNNESKSDGDGGDEDNEHFDVFHIFEFADDPTTKITPKLSTNCTEPRKIIDVLCNRTGSDTPQLQRLIEKLSAQHKKWTEIHKKQQQNANASAEAPTTITPSTTAAAAATKVTDSNLILDGRDHTYNRRTGPLPRASVATANPIASTAIRPSNVPTVSNIPPIRSTSIEPTIVKTEKPSEPSIRVKTIESLNDANQTPDNRPKLQAFAKKSVTIARTSNGAYRLKLTNGAKQQQQQQHQQQQPRPTISQITRMPNANFTAASVTTIPASTVSIIQPKLSTVKQTQVSSVQQRPPVKLWNDSLIKDTNKPLMIHVSVKTRDTNQGDDNSKVLFSLDVPQENPIENDANDGASMLKIGQVFEGVNEDMVDLLQIVPSPPPSSSLSAPTPPPTPQPPPFAIQSVQSSASPLLDTLVKEISNDQSSNVNGMQTAYLNDDNVKLVTIVQNDDKSCADYRCNICLTFNDSNAQYREHMLRQHGFKVICENCHDAFNHQQAFINHLKIDGGTRSMKCSLSANANRTYICIVEPPIILMRNEKVFAFRCKYCDLAFSTQRAFVQHAQRHAKLFRCKQCPTKPLNINLMRVHLTHHKN